MGTNKSILFAGVILFFLPLLQARYITSCPYPPYEISFGYGYLSQHQMGILYKPNFAADILHDITGNENLNTSVRAVGPFNFTYKFFYKQWYSAGFSAVYSYNHITDSKVGSDKMEYNYHTFAIVPRLDFYYIRNPKFAFYGFVAGGFNVDILNNQGSSSSRAKEINAAYQVSPLCLRFGKMMGFVIEMGFGTLGTVNAGLSYRHYERQWSFYK